MKKKIINVLKFTVFASLGVFLFWKVYKDYDFAHFMSMLKNDVSYGWVVLSLLFGVLSHISRTLRWKIALEPLGENPKTSNAFIAVMAGYFMNLMLPRAGEVVRCGLITKYEKIPFSKLLGTVVTERIVDLIMLGVLTIAVLALEMGKVVQFSKQNPEVLNKLNGITTSPILWIGLLLMIVLFVVYIKFSKKKDGKNKLMVLIEEFVEGIKSVLTMKRKFAYIAHSFFIWIMYFLMLYVLFFSLDITKHLSLSAALTTFVFTTFGMVAPVPGGIGAWHFMAFTALSLFGIPIDGGKDFALLAHSSTNLTVLIVGAICLIIMPIINRSYIPRNTKTTSDTTDPIQNTINN